MTAYASTGRAAMGAILPVKQHGERLLSGMAPKPPNDRLGSIAAKPARYSSV